MANDTRTLTLAIHANTEIARAQLKELAGYVGIAGQQIDARLSDIEAKFASVSQGISGSKAALLGGVAGFLGGLTAELTARLPTALVAAARSAISYAGSLGEVSRQLGVGAEWLQEYRFAATQSGASIEQADDAAQHFGATLGKAADGNKRAAASFRAVGVEIADSNGRLKPAEQLFGEVAAAIAKVEDPARRVAYATALFGENGARILPVLEAGAEGFNDFAAAARQLGLVIDQATIDKLDGLEDKLSAIKQVITTQMAVAIASNADAIVALGNAAGGAAGQLSEFLQRARGIKAIYQDHGILGLISASAEDELRYGTAAGRKADLEAGVRGAQQRLRAAKSGRAPSNGITGPTVAALEAELAHRRKLLADFLASPEYQAAARAGVVPATAGGMVASTPAAVAAQAVPKAKTPFDFDAAIEAMPKIGAALDDAAAGADRLLGKMDGTGKTVEEIVGSTLNLADALQLLQIPPLIDEEEQRRIEEFGHDLSQNVGLALIYGQKLGPALVNSLKAATAEAVASNLFELLTGGKGGGGGLLGLAGGAFKSILGFADGGDPPVGQWSLVGENGPELIKPRGAMTVVPNHRLGAALARGGGGGQSMVALTVKVEPSPLLLVATQTAAQAAGARAASVAIRDMNDTGIGRL